MYLTDAEVNIEKLKQIKKNIKKYSPYPEKVKIIAVTKTLSSQTIKNAIKNKLKIIGENKVQETTEKQKQLKDTADRVKIHLIGKLQTNKIKKAIKLYSTIQTIDKEKTAIKINEESKKTNKKQKIFIQINIAKNPKQAGINPNQLQSIINKIKKMKNIQITGIMAIGPKTTNKKKIKEAYKKMQKIYKETKKRNKEIKDLSLGMSGDYKIALKCGATMIRIGTSLFGKRK